MPAESARSLATYLLERTQSSLRAVVHYDGPDYTVHYVRDDLSTDGTPDRLYEVLENVVSGDPSDDELRSAFGDVRASVQVRERGLIVHLPVDDDAGVIVSLEPNVASQLDEFVTECTRRI